MTDIDKLTIKEANDLLSKADGVRKAMTAPGTSIAPAASSGRYVVVVDRGWIFAGDMSETPDGFVRLDDAVHVFKWSSIGFAKMLTDWRSENVDLRPVISTEIPKASVIFRVPVEAGWGKK